MSKLYLLLCICMKRKENGFHEHFLRNIGKGGTSSDFIAITFSSECFFINPISLSTK